MDLGLFNRGDGVDLFQDELEDCEDFPLPDPLFLRIKVQHFGTDKWKYEYISAGAYHYFYQCSEGGHLDDGMFYEVPCLSE